MAADANLDETTPTPPKPRRRAPAWLTTRVTLMALLVVAIAVAGSGRVIERLQRPSVGDRYDVRYEAEDECAWIWVRVDGLTLRGQGDLEGPPIPAGDGTLVLDRVSDLPDGDGYATDGTLTLADGSELSVSGGTEGEVFFTLGCAIRN